MPTSYTNYIQNGKIDNAKEFLLLCARSFGATITMREEPLNAPIPKFKPSNYCLKQVRKEKIELEKYKNMNLKEAQKKIDRKFKDDIKSYKEYILKYEKEKEKYEKILNEVKQWRPPTKDHNNLKDFAIQQLEDSIKIDCDTKFMKKFLKEKKPNAETWLMDKMECCIKNIKYYQEEYNKEVKNVQEKNKWINDLKNSFNEPKTSNNQINSKWYLYSSTR